MFCSSFILVSWVMNFTANWVIGVGGIREPPVLRQWCNCVGRTTGS